MEPANKIPNGTHVCPRDKKPKEQGDYQCSSPDQYPAHARSAHFALFVERVEYRSPRSVRRQRSRVFAPHFIFIQIMREPRRKNYSKKKSSPAEPQNFIDI